MPVVFDNLFGVGFLILGLQSSLTIYLVEAFYCNDYIEEKLLVKLLAGASYPKEQITCILGLEDLARMQ